MGIIVVTLFALISCGTFASLLPGASSQDEPYPIPSNETEKDDKKGIWLLQGAP